MLGHKLTNAEFSVRLTQDLILRVLLAFEIPRLTNRQMQALKLAAQFELAFECNDTQSATTTFFLK